MIYFKEICIAFTQQWVSCAPAAAAASQLLQGCCLIRKHVCLTLRFQIEVTTVNEQQQTADNKRVVECVHHLSVQPVRPF